MNLKQAIAETNPDAMFIDEHDSALIGMGGAFGKVLAVYDRAKIITNLVNKGMSAEEAATYCAYNIDGAWVGDNTPIIVDLILPDPSHHGPQDQR